MSMLFDRLYFDIATNFVSGKGKYLEFESVFTTATNKYRVFAGNVGIKMQVKRLLIIPHIGIATEQPIFEDPVGFDTHFYGRRKLKRNMGFTLAAPINESTHLNLGAGTYEQLKIGVSFHY